MFTGTWCSPSPLPARRCTLTQTPKPHTIGDEKQSSFSAFHTNIALSGPTLHTPYAPRSAVQQQEENEDDRQLGPENSAMVTGIYTKCMPCTKALTTPYKHANRTNNPPMQTLYGCRKRIHNHMLRTRLRPNPILSAVYHFPTAHPANQTHLQRTNEQRRIYNTGPTYVVSLSSHGIIFVQKMECTSAPLSLTFFPTS